MSQAPADRYSALLDLCELLSGLRPFVEGDRQAWLTRGQEFAYQLAREAHEAARRPIVLRHLGDGIWEVGEEGCTRRLRARSAGVAAAHQVLRGDRVLADKALVHAARKTAAAWAKQAGCPRLADLMASRIRESGGFLEYHPGPAPVALVLH